MASSSTTLKAGDNLPPRGKSKRTLILEAIKASSLMDTSPNCTQEEAEMAFFTHVARQASNPESEHFGMCLKLLADKGWSNIKPTMDYVQFEFSDELTPSQQAAQVIKAASNGEIAPDVAKMFIDSITSMLKITEVTELQDRIDALESAMNG